MVRVRLLRCKRVWNIIWGAKRNGVFGAGSTGFVVCWRGGGGEWLFRWPRVKKRRACNQRYLPTPTLKICCGETWPAIAQNRYRPAGAGPKPTDANDCVGRVGVVYYYPQNTPLTTHHSPTPSHLPTRRFVSHPACVTRSLAQVHAVKVFKARWPRWRCQHTHKSDIMRPTNLAGSPLTFSPDRSFQHDHFVILSPFSVERVCLACCGRVTRFTLVINAL